MSRLWLQSIPIEAEGEPPTAFVWEGRRYVVHEVVRQWRIDTEWWRGRIWRTVYTVITTGGLCVDLYRDCLTGAWYLQRVWD